MGDITNADIIRPVYPAKEMLNSFALAGTRPPSSITPTRITSQSATCIDIIAVNEDIQVKSYTVIPSATSDHFPVIAVIYIVSTPPDKVKPIIKRSFSRVDFEALSQRVADISTHLDSSPDILLEEWQTKFVEILDDVAPIRRCDVTGQSSRTSLGRRRPGVVGATLYNHRLGITVQTQRTHSLLYVTGTRR